MRSSGEIFDSLARSRISSGTRLSSSRLSAVAPWPLTAPLMPLRLSQAAAKTSAVTHRIFVSLE